MACRGSGVRAPQLHRKGAGQGGYADPELDTEAAHETTGQYLCTAEALWPNGLQEGIGRPIALELDEWEAHDKLAARGYDVFTSVGALRTHVERLEEGALVADWQAADLILEQIGIDTIRYEPL